MLKTIIKLGLALLVCLLFLFLFGQLHIYFRGLEAVGLIVSLIIGHAVLMAGKVAILMTGKIAISLLG